MLHVLHVDLDPGCDNFEEQFEVAQAHSTLACLMALYAPRVMLTLSGDVGHHRHPILDLLMQNLKRCYSLIVNAINLPEYHIQQINQWSPTGRPRCQKSITVDIEPRHNVRNHCLTSGLRANQIGIPDTRTAVVNAIFAASKLRRIESVDITGVDHGSETMAVVIPSHWGVGTLTTQRPVIIKEGAKVQQLCIEFESIFTIAGRVECHGTIDAIELRNCSRGYAEQLGVDASSLIRIASPCYSMTLKECKLVGGYENEKKGSASPAAKLFSALSHVRTMVVSDTGLSQEDIKRYVPMCPSLQLLRLGPEHLPGWHKLQCYAHYLTLHQRAIDLSTVTLLACNKDQKILLALHLAADVVIATLPFPISQALVRAVLAQINFDR
eukprot:TRINITY_DN10786_c0_g1_i1.p1 TRINITY_DN10786_c0_g1~~TRINITY_DN10786_c0_g1_i1.p1  ORF type:complete len:382 (+),score=44.89 TRINITY_DN10786_c0_g1_i1:374-1519(+)